MRKIYLVIFLASIFCQSVGNYAWQQLTSMPSNGRVGAVGFAIGNKLYYGLGDYNYSIQYKDVWEYDTDLDIWTQKSDIPGSERVSATSFSVNGYGYIGLGWSAYIGAVALTDFYKYDPSNNTWTTISQYPGTGVFNANNFVLNGFVYVGLGGTVPQNMFKYDPINDSWTSVANFPGAAIQSATSFAVNNIGYVCGGWDGNAVITDLWAYNPISNIWTQKTSIPVARGSAIAFVLGNKAFVGTGGTGNFGGTQDMYEYDYLANSWTFAPSFPGNPLNGFRGLSTDDAAYGFGGGDASIGYYSNELWKFSDVTSIITHENNIPEVFYNSTNQCLEIQFTKISEKLQIDLYTISGQEILSNEIVDPITSISLGKNGLNHGNYIYTISNGHQILTSQKLLIY